MRYGEDYAYPKWAEAMGVCMSLASMVWVPAYAIYYLVTQPGTFREVFHFKFATKTPQTNLLTPFPLLMLLSGYEGDSRRILGCGTRPNTPRRLNTKSYSSHHLLIHFISCVCRGKPPSNPYLGR